MQEIELKGSDEKTDLLNSGCFKTILNFAGILHKTTSDRMENSTVFKENSAIIQNEIFECVLQSINKVIAQILKAPLIADETTDVSVQN